MYYWAGSPPKSLCTDKIRRPYCPHCLHVAPVWQTLYEYYYTSKPVPAGSSADSASTSLNTFTAYYNYHFANLDCVAFGSACTDHGVTSFPTFILYKDGEELKRFEGAKDMKGLSAFVEDALETIRPGSRPIGGPRLPDAGDKSSEDYQARAPAPAANSPATTTSKDQEPVADTKLTPAVSQAAAASKIISASGALKATPAKKKTKPTKPAKPTSIPNPLGKSISLTAESFQNLVTMSQEPWFIKFYAPWCGHCKAMAPNWVQLAKEMEGKLHIGGRSPPWISYHPFLPWWRAC